jgi:transposase-like protein
MPGFRHKRRQGEAAMSVTLTDPMFHAEEAARLYFEAQRWPNGPFCPHCGVTDDICRMEGQSHQPGMCYCRGCGKKFTVTVGSVMERSHISLTKWALAFRLMAGSKKGVSAHQLHRSLGITYKSAWFMAHRIREAMREENPPPLGGEGKIVEADEAYHGKRETPVKLARGRSVRQPRAASQVAAINARSSPW